MQKSHVHVFVAVCSSGLKKKEAVASQNKILCDIMESSFWEIFKTVHSSVSLPVNVELCENVPCRILSIPR